MILPDKANIIVLASNFNPTIISKDWLYNRGIFTQAVDNFMHNPMIAVVENSDFILAVEEQKFQLSLKRVTNDNMVTASAIVKRFIDVLLETPYKAIGFNYHYIVKYENCRLQNLLSPNSNKMAEIFSKDYELGTIIIFKYLGFVTTLNVTPSLLEEKPIKISLNFHANIADISELRGRIVEQASTLQKAETIIQELCNNG